MFAKSVGDNEITFSNSFWIDNACEIKNDLPIPDSPCNNTPFIFRFDELFFNLNIYKICESCVEKPAN